MKQISAILVFAICLMFNSCTSAVTSSTNTIAASSTPPSSNSIMNGNSIMSEKIPNPFPSSSNSNSSNTTPKPSVLLLEEKPDESVQAIQSRYTNLSGKSCRTIEESDEGAYSLEKCPGIGGYKISVSYSDGRINITPICAKCPEHNIHFSQFTESYTSLEVNQKLEWLLKRQGKELVPIALVIRYNAGDGIEDTSKRPLYLMIVKMTQTETCAVAIVKADNDTNGKVKQIANAALSKPCLEPPQWGDKPLIFEVVNL